MTARRERNFFQETFFYSLWESNGSTGESLDRSDRRGFAGTTSTRLRARGRQCLLEPIVFRLLVQTVMGKTMRRILPVAACSIRARERFFFPFSKSNSFDNLHNGGKTKTQRQRNNKATISSSSGRYISNQCYHHACAQGIFWNQNRAAMFKLHSGKLKLRSELENNFEKDTLTTFAPVNHKPTPS